MLGYARFRAAYEEGFYPLYEKPPGSGGFLLIFVFYIFKTKISFNIILNNV